VLGLPWHQMISNPRSKIRLVGRAVVRCTREDIENQFVLVAIFENIYRYEEKGNERRLSFIYYRQIRRKGNEELPSQPRELFQGKGGQMQRALVFKTSPHVLTPKDRTSCLYV
jgi:hypothetical protein